MTKIYLLKRPFSLNDRFSREYLKSNGIIYTKNLLEADVIVSKSSELSTYKLLKKLLFFKKFIVWSNEPRQDSVHKNLKDKRSIVMNVYSGDVFLHNLHFLGSYHNIFQFNLGIDLQSPPGVPLTPERLKEKTKFCVAVFAYRDPQKSELLINGKQTDLNGPRQDLAIFLNKINKADIVGGNWPQHMKIRESSGFESGGNNWWDTKIDLLKSYKFNICFENTISPYYCTEKIWHAIAGGCLPIYYGEGTAIYETFPKNSFVDASKFKSNEDLLHFLENIPAEEHINRYNICLEIMHKSCVKRLQNPDLKTDILDQFIKNINLLVKK